MERKHLIAIGSALIIVLMAVLWLWSHKVLDNTAELDRLTISVFQKFGLSKIGPIAQSKTEKIYAGRKCLHIDRIFEIQGRFNWSDFDSDLKERLKNSGFHVSHSDYKHKPTRESYYADIAFGRFIIMTLRVDQKIPAPKVKTEAVEVKPTETKKHPRVAIVIDDFGYTTANLETLFAINEPVTFSVLPNLQHSREIAQLARSRGYEVILHLPMEPHGNKVTLEPDTIKCGMARKEVLIRLAKHIAGIPGLSGVNNHMGSKATEDSEIMTEILSYLKDRNLFFLDSMTSQKSVCAAVAKTVGERFAQRDVFLDNSSNTDYIIAQMAKLEKLALRRGYAIGICHDRKNSIHVLSRMMPEMVNDGIEFVPLSDLVQ